MGFLNLESIFSNLEKDIDPPTVDQIINENPFLMEYSKLLYKKRDFEVLKILKDKAINKVEELENSDNSEEVNDPNQIDTEELNNTRETAFDAEERLNNYEDIDALLKKWNTHIDRISRDISAGKSLLSSTLNNFK